MPFESEAQRRFMWAKHPEIAERWAHEYPGQHDLPYHKKKKHKKAAHFLTHFLKPAAYQVGTGMGASLPAMPALRPAASAAGPAMPQANALIPPGQPGSNQDVHTQAQQPAQGQPPGWQPSAAAQAAPAHDIPSMILRQAEALLNPQQPKQATHSQEQNMGPNSAQTSPPAGTVTAVDVLEKCAYLLKQAYPFRPFRGYRPMPFQGYPGMGYGGLGMGYGGMPFYGYGGMGYPGMGIPWLRVLEMPSGREEARFTPPGTGPRAGLGLPALSREGRRLVVPWPRDVPDGKPLLYRLPDR
jgi:hypothetical protein